MVTANPDPHAEEVRNRVEYATQHGDEQFRPLERHGHTAHERLNQEFYGGSLRYVHLDFLLTSPRALCQFRSMTGYGARDQMLINERFALGTNRDWVVRGFPSDGFCRVFNDMIVRMIAEQACFDLHHLRRGNNGFLPALTRECNRIGLTLGLPPVVERRRPTDPDDVPLVAHFPCCVRPEGFYGDDVTPEFEARLRGSTYERHAAQRQTAPVVCEYFHWLLVSGQADRLRQILERQCRLAEVRRLRRIPGLRRMEEGKLDVDGKSPLPEVQIEAGWVLANNRLVARLAEGIALDRSFGYLPILGDALQDMGCANDPLLRHLYAPIEHTHRCFVLEKIEAIARACEPG